MSATGRKRSILIRDGYTFKGRIEERAGLWPEVHFEYRPALQVQANDYLTRPRRNGEEATAADVELVARHLVRWDATAEDGALLPIKADTLRGIWQPVIQIFINHILGYTASEQAADAGNSAGASGSGSPTLA
jgi:hypothetical protein